jgi:hypothetical protein
MTNRLPPRPPPDLSRGCRKAAPLVSERPDVHYLA